MYPESLEFTGFQGIHFMHPPKKSFYPGKPCPETLDFTAFAGAA